MRLANIPVILGSGDFDENGENLLARVNLAKKSPKVWKKFKWNYLLDIPRDLGQLLTHAKYFSCLKIKRGDWKYNTNYHEILPKTKLLQVSHFIN